MRRIQGQRFVVAMAILALAFVAVPSHASTFIAMDMNQMVAASNAVVQGQVIETKSFWDAENRIIVTDATVAVVENVTGTTGRYVTVRTFGGEVNGYTVEAHGFPKFTAGDEVLLFIREAKEVDGSIRVTGYQQGQYNIVVQNGVEMAIPAVDGEVALVNKQGGTVSIPNAMRLDDLKAQINRTARLVGEMNQ